MLKVNPIKNHTCLAFRGEKEIQDIADRANATKINQVGLFSSKIDSQLREKQISLDDVAKAAERVTNKFPKKMLLQTVEIFKKYL